METLFCARRAAPALALILFAALLCAPAPARAEGLWRTIAPLLQGRAGHTATLLPDGRVLVAGGYRTVSRYEPGVSGDLASAELYDPAIGAWVATGALGEARHAHTATLLRDGRVLVAGGLGAGGYRASAELYSPAAGTWAQAAQLAQGRSGHTATLLPDGRVLVAGGYGPGGEVGPSELFDPATGAWSPGGALAVPRTGHTATPLQDGRVLVVGGSGGSCGGALAGAELYEPATNRWLAATPAPHIMCGHTATLLPGGEVLVVWADGAWRYDPAADRWRAAARPAYVRIGHGAAALADGRVLVVGGTTPGAWYEARWVPQAAIYDGGADAWSGAGSYTVRGAALTVLDDGRALVSGGLVPTGFVPLEDWTTGAAQLFDPAINRQYLPELFRPQAETRAARPVVS